MARCTNICIPPSHTNTFNVGLKSRVKLEGPFVTSMNDQPINWQVKSRGLHTILNGIYWKFDRYNHPEKCHAFAFLSIFPTCDIPIKCGSIVNACMHEWAVCIIEIAVSLDAVPSPLINGKSFRAKPGATCNHGGPVQCIVSIERATEKGTDPW